MKKLMDYECKKLKWCCLSILFLNCMILSLSLKIEKYIYDSSYYWTIAEPVYSEGGFNLLLFPETFRGCLLPILILFSKTIFQGVWGWRILSATMVAMIIGLFIPKILKFQVNCVKNALRVVISELIFLYFWGHFLQYPLSDLPAIFFLCAGIYYILLLYDFLDEKVLLEDKIGGMVPIGFGGIIGGCLYAAYNCRAVFLYGVIIVVLIVGIKLIQEKKGKQLMYVFLGGLLGTFIAACPQCAINKQYVGVFSPKVYTEAFTQYKSSLQAMQVIWGLKYSKYETYIGDITKYKSAGVYFDDVIGNRIIAEENITPDNFKISSIFRVFIKYPLDTIGIYTRHLIALITPVWNQVYITNIYTNKSLVILVSIAMWIILWINIFTLRGKMVFLLQIWSIFYRFVSQLFCSCSGHQS